MQNRPSPPNQPKNESIHQGVFRLLDNHNHGSYATKYNRKKVALKIATELYRLGYKSLSANNLKLKHVKALIAHWTTEEVSTGTIKNRMAVLRWWSCAIGKNNLIPRDNRDLGIDNRAYVTNNDKSIMLTTPKLGSIENEAVKASLMLQRDFGLRREESIKFMYSYAIQPTFIRLKGTWCKGGRYREIPYTDFKQQNETLEYVKSVTKKIKSHSLIPGDLSYAEQLYKYEYQLQLHNINRAHGLRHQYAHKRYRQITGIECPCLFDFDNNIIPANIDEMHSKATNIITQELGHNRPEITHVYLGSWGKHTRSLKSKVKVSPKLGSTV